jgi:hypothetical protein
MRQAYSLAHIPNRYARPGDYRAIQHSIHILPELSTRTGNLAGHALPLLRLLYKVAHLRSWRSRLYAHQVWIQHMKWEKGSGAGYRWGRNLAEPAEGESDRLRSINIQLEWSNHLLSQRLNTEPDKRPGTAPSVGKRKGAASPTQSPNRPKRCTITERRERRPQPMHAADRAAWWWFEDLAQVGWAGRVVYVSCPAQRCSMQPAITQKHPRISHHLWTELALRPVGITPPPDPRARIDLPISSHLAPP